MSLALFAMIQELKAEVTALTNRVVMLEAHMLSKPEPAPKAEPPRPTLSLSKRA